MSDSKKPTFKTTNGRVSAAVWANESKENGVFHTVTFERSYQDGEEYKTSSSYGVGSDLSNLERCIFDVKVWYAQQAQK